VAHDQVETAGAPARLELTPDRTELEADGEDVALVKVTVRDEQGHIVPTANNLISFHVNGEGKVIGVCNGDPASHEPDKATQRRTFNGNCLAIFQAGDHVNNVRLTAVSPGLRSVEIVINVRKRSRD